MWCHGGIAYISIHCQWMDITYTCLRQAMMQCLCCGCALQFFMSSLSITSVFVMTDVRPNSTASVSEKKNQYYSELT